MMGFQNDGVLLKTKTMTRAQYRRHQKIETYSLMKKTKVLKLGQRQYQIFNAGYIMGVLNFLEKIIESPSY